MVGLPPPTPSACIGPRSGAMVNQQEVEVGVIRWEVASPRSGSFGLCSIGSILPGLKERYTPL
jgi:hypothetical protein